MGPVTEKFLLDFMGHAKALHIYSGKRASNPVENPYWMNLLEGAAKALTVVAIGTLDWKLGAISKLLESWLDDKRREYAETQRKTEYGYNVNLIQNVPSSDSNSWSHTYY
jgi:hypothetical protein